ncbi:unnamed protein product [Menidia menidia]|uniref:(Atlantic silverside) hypothetical protein n=1 Tax=Menidia menidia TaxID=238744 RepID=A0A8S4AXM4_9TELE|nr:unnamed protein product [Menidia menidia]
MADVSLDEVIRRRGINLKAPAKRPVFGRTIGGDGKSFDARQKIGNNDVRQRLGGGTGFPVKDAREKLVQKDARFKIRGTVGAGAVQDARQMINSRKQGQSQLGPLAQTTLKTAIASQLQSKALVPQIQIHASNNLAGVITRQFASSGQGLGARGSVTPQLSNNVRMMDARDRLSLKRSIGGTQAHAAAAAPPLKITKTIQSGAVGSTFSMSAPITKVVKNDAYTAPRPPVPVAPTRPNTSMAAARSSAAALQPISRTLQQSTTEARTPAPTPPQPTFSPLEGTKITVNNLHPRVTEEDIVELFCVCGALKRARLVKVGVAEVVFVRKEDAVSAYRKYNNRCLDVLSLKFTSDSVAQHFLYVKEHRVRAEKSSRRPLDRTLFVLNIPPYCSEGVVKDLFSQFGSVDSVELRDHPGSFQDDGPRLSRLFRPAEKKGFKVGYVVFQNSSSLPAVKSHPHEAPLVVCTEQRPVATGVQKWIQQYTECFIQPEKIQQVVDSFMQDYDKRKEEEAEQQKQEAEKQQEEEEGWVKVTRGHKGAKARPHSEAADKKTLRKEMKKKKRKELMNFYTWQHRNTQKEHIADLRKKFEEDKQKIALLRAQRKFRPY